MSLVFPLFHLDLLRGMTPKAPVIAQARTDFKVSVDVDPGLRLWVPVLIVMASASNAGPVNVKIGFSSTVLPADSESGAEQIIGRHKIAPGSGFYALPGVGPDGMELMITNDAPSDFISINYLYDVIKA